ncbi:long-chain-fatty-acid--CoA ligase ACSBG2-like [Palaemon carinicauda]|uniref:long-chain-fatty-acid--CoA ligase ACSBG2-like n=1 Tax=Palaemon carinicauda TaxID=392227 RepID=UPI0035B67EBE
MDEPGPLEELTEPEPRDGPDQILPATAIKVWEAHHPVKLHVTRHGMASDKPVSIYTMFKNSATNYPKQPAMAVKRDEVWKYWTLEEYFHEVKTVAKALIRLGLERFKGVCIMGFNSPEWAIANFGTIFAGGLVAGVYTSNLPEACRHIAENCSAQIIFVEDAIALNKFLAVKRFLPEIKAIVQWSGVPGAPGVLSWAELMAIGLAERDDELNERLSLQAVNQCCSLIYTSGTTGPPKGVMCSQDNLTWITKEFSKHFGIKMATGVTVSYLPLSHVAGLVLDLLMSVYTAATIYFAQPDALKGSLGKTLSEVQPTIFLGVPRIWEKMYEKLLDVEANAGFVKKSVANWARYHGLNYYHALLSGRSLSISERMSYSLARKLFIDKVRAAVGFNHCEHFVTGTAPIAKDILTYFMSVGIPICEGCSTSESLSVGGINELRPGRYKLGSIGKPMPQATIMLKPHPLCKPGEGEITYKGRCICMGYLRMPEKTNEAIEDDGFFHTGDIGRFDEDGFLYITGRIKEIIITAGGENIPPKLIEEHVKREIPFLSSAMVVGDKRKYLTILLTLIATMNPDTGEPLQELTEGCQFLLKKIGSNAKTVPEAIAEIKADPSGPLATAIQQGIDRYNNLHAISNAQRIQRWTILPVDFSAYNGELTSTLKLVRSNALERHKDAIDEMYDTPNPIKITSKL